MSKVLQQFKARRLALGLRQEDMASRAGMSRQQYQRLERQGNPRLQTLELLAKGLKGELMLIPRDKVALVNALLSPEPESIVREALSSGVSKIRDDADQGSLADDPWGDSLG